MTPSENVQHKWVLVVDDDEAFLKAITRYLEEQGYRVVPASNISGARTKLVNQKFDCILLDMKFERGSGEVVIEELRRNPGFNQVAPIIVMSGFLDKTMVTRISLNVQRIMVKPFDRETMGKAIGEVIAAAPRKTRG